ncbi:MAG: response regulator [Deltaproteobacteria bacterium]|nr:MAG: response regulator [Deltaproteobacteria bacterium]
MTRDGRTSGSVSVSLASGMRELVGAEVLVVDKDPKVQKGMTQLLSSASLHVSCEADPEAALALAQRKFFSVAIVDLDTPVPSAGLDTIARLKEISPTTMVVMLTPRKAFDESVRAIRAGAVDIVWKSPEQVEHLLDRVMDAAGRSVGKREVDSILREVRDTYDDFLKRFMDAERRALDAAGGVSVVGVDEVRVLVVAPDAVLHGALVSAAASGFSFDLAHSGGEALDRCSTVPYQIAIVSETLPDLPGSMVVRSIRTQSRETLVLRFTGPGPGGRVELVETSRAIPVVDPFTAPQQLADRLDELAQAFRAKSRERRYAQAFRERHYDFLRRFVELKLKIDRQLGGSGG